MQSNSPSLTRRAVLEPDHSPDNLSVGGQIVERANSLQFPQQLAGILIAIRRILGNHSHHDILEHFIDRKLECLWLLRNFVSHRCRSFPAGTSRAAGALPVNNA